MKNIIMPIAAAVLLMTACVKENAPVPETSDGNLVPMVFSASADTKTSLVPGDGTSTVAWSSTDRISVWDGTANREFTVESCDGSSATFTGMVSEDATEFYAVYPYSEDLAVSAPDNTERDIRIRFPFSSTQYLRPGDFPEGGAFAVAKAEGTALAFQNRTGLIRFSLADDLANVKSIAIAGNAGTEYIHGTVNVEFAGSTVYQGIAYGTDRGSSVTFCHKDGTNLQTGVDYYMALPGVNFSTGFTITLTCDDNTTLSKSSDKVLQIMSKKIYPLTTGPISKSMFETEDDNTGDVTSSYYAAYTAGQDIMIAGQAYNKSVYGEGTLVKAGETVDLTDGNTVYFVEPGAVTKIGPTYSSDKYIVIGDDPAQRTAVTQAAAIKIGKADAHYAFLNLDFNSTISEATSGSANDVLTVANSGSTIERIAYDNCHIELTGRYNIYNSNSTFKDIAYHNCDFVVTVTGHDVPLIKCDSSTSADYQSLDLQNNLFWHSSAFSSANYAFNVVLAVNANALDNIVVKNNTFINLRTRSSNAYYFHINNTGSYTSNSVTYEVEGEVDSAVLEGNIIYIDDSNLSGHWNFLRASATAGSAANNYAYYANETTYKFYFGGKIAGQSKSMTTLTSSPFSSLTIDDAGRTCTVVKADAYKDYGAAR